MAEELHFGRAAARLYITQPALSHAVARMERQLEVRLLRRTRSSVELTEAGAELLHHGRRLLADLEGTVARVRMTGRGETGLIRVGVAHLAEPLVAPALAAFQTDHPSIVVDRSAMVSERLLEQLAEGRLHAAVIPGSGFTQRQAGPGQPGAQQPGAQEAGQPAGTRDQVDGLVDDAMPEHLLGLRGGRPRTGRVRFVIAERGLGRAWLPGRVRLGLAAQCGPWPA